MAREAVFVDLAYDGAPQWIRTDAIEYLAETEGIGVVVGLTSGRTVEVGGLLLSEAWSRLRDAVASAKKHGA
jgi:hypothetical protein